MSKLLINALKVNGDCMTFKERVYFSVQFVPNVKFAFHFRRPKVKLMLLLKCILEVRPHPLSLYGINSLKNLFVSQKEKHHTSRGREYKNLFSG